MSLNWQLWHDIRYDNQYVGLSYHISTAFFRINDREAFKNLLNHGFTQAGCTHNLLSDSGIELLRMASKGNPRQAHQLIVTALRLACDKKLLICPMIL